MTDTELTNRLKPSFFKTFRSSLKREFPFFIGSPALIWQMIFFYLPLFLMIISSVIRLSHTGKFEGLTLEHFKTISGSTFIVTILESLGVAFFNAIICLFLAFPFAYFVAFKVKKFKTLFLIFLIVPFWTNFLLHVCAWFFVLEKNGFLNNLLLSLNLIQEPIHFLNSFFSIMLMMVYHYFPFMVLPIYSALEKFDYSLLLASSDLGASRIQTLRRILLPILLPAMRLGFFLVYIPSFGEFVIPELMGGDKRYFVGNIVTQYVLGESTGSLGAAYTVLSCFALVLSIFFIHYLTKKLSTSLIGASR